MIRPARTVLAALAGGVLALTLAAAASVPARAGTAAAAASDACGLASAAPAQPSVAITSVSPDIARPHSTVTVSGVVANPSASSVAGLQVTLWSSSTPLKGTSAMRGYLSMPPPTGLDSQVGPAWSAAVPLAAHACVSFSLKLPVSDVGMTTFGVYPLAAQLTWPAGLAEARTFLPFWPGRARERHLKQVSIAWVWPLIGTPDQAACPSLLSGRLATSLSPGGRLGQLLAAGRSPDAVAADLTWAIDPALLAEASAMTRPYHVGGTATCSGASARPASAAARAWLAGVRDVARNQDYFVTPYDDVDVAALAHRGLNSELASAFRQGRAEAQHVLGGTQRPDATPSADGTGWIAWPANGLADGTVVNALAAPPNKVGTFILSDSLMPPASPAPPYTPSAVTSTPNGLGSQAHVLLADTTITQDILGEPAGAVPGLVSTVTAAGTVSGPPGAAAFAQSQWFLAETAMIAYEDPAVARSLVVTPPRRWDPGASLAGALLKDTVTAPWLRPASLGGLVAGRQSGQAQRQPLAQKNVSRSELKPSLLRQVGRLVHLTGLQGSILTPPQPQYLSRAVAAAESSAWRGGRAGRRRAEALLHRVRDHVLAQLQQVTIIRTLRVTLGGKSGEVPVSVSNNLAAKVTVRVEVTVAPGDRATVGRSSHIFSRVVTVAGKTQRTIKIPVQAAQAGPATLSLRLSTPGGSSLPGKPVLLTVEATHFGTLALVIIGVALLVFVVTAGARAIRRGGGRAAAAAGAGDDEGGGEREDAGQPGGGTHPGPVSAAREPDTVEPGQGDGADAVKEPDDQATTPGQAGQAGRAGRR